MYVDKSTRTERAIVEDAMYALMGDVDGLHAEIMSLWERHFSCLEQKDIDRYTAAEIGRHLRSISDCLFDVLLQYSLYVGDTDFRGYRPYMEGAKRAALAVEVNGLDARACDLWRAANDKGDLERADAIRKTRDVAGSMPDEQALPLLRSLVKEGNVL